MRLPEDIRQAFVRHGRRGGRFRAARMTPEARRAVARGAATSRWIRERFGNTRFEAVGLPGGDTLTDPEDRLYTLLSRTDGDLAHSRYLACLAQMTLFAEACRVRRLPKTNAR